MGPVGSDLHAVAHPPREIVRICASSVRVENNVQLDPPGSSPGSQHLKRRSSGVTFAGRAFRPSVPPSLSATAAGSLYPAAHRLA